MRRKSSVSCKINKKLLFTQCKPGYFSNKIDSWFDDEGTSNGVPLDTDGYEFDHYCCGIYEFTFGDLQDQFLATNPEHRLELVSKYIQYQCKHRETGPNTVVFFGFPINHKYHTFYKLLMPYLEQLGFTRLTRRPYKNANSGNSIHVYCGQF